MKSLPLPNHEDDRFLFSSVVDQQGLRLVAFRTMKLGDGLWRGSLEVPN